MEPDERARRQGQKYWNAEDERYYDGGANGDARRRSQGSLDSGSTAANSGNGGGGRWHYPANFEDSLPTDVYGGGSGSGNGNGVGVAGDGAPGSRKKKSKKSKKDRWERTEDAYSLPQEERPRKKKSSMRRKNRSTVGDGGDFERQSANASIDSEPGFPEDAEGGLYGDRYAHAAPTGTATGERRENDELQHEF